ncbi:holin [Sediminibacillus halophilus]|uniref:Bacteriophage A118-like holin, Hol118 n=1 Tax=Sediminibacillus halophilus TaxID=482461 RepID=A0A1G9QUZ8_9BACI|nr:holin [Sediminibacillus halophilus]SDM14437.1 Bacteriophage A118-like holin, Hol118 [Sediminibacillus halophilus]
MEDVLIFATVILPIVTALVELVKRTVTIPKNIVPSVSFLVGIAIGAAAYPFTDLELVLRLWAGGFAGLAGTGLFELAVNKREGTTK